ncbi:hypothetical protein FE784_07625 [Paenibacillus hemerocallicola]|uniref:Polysaccharide biosynthesis protein n=1 Tax=Paenibacillus hemerocallicola TaxID=1172614 RepID=A0A5C4TE77_9BACL|nr:oligosaccharide flippase family protein [Paenibacillus hemerocallicola]TNJ66749.1 hypothetical protein FE784_07625 [Paenibacillus hemerocallicola]
MEEKRVTKLINNMIYAFTAQGISFVLSIIMSLVIPKLLGVEEYSYWQLFIFYSSYIGFLHFGLNDGIYLRIGGVEYEKLNHRSIGSQFWLIFIFHCMLALIVIVCSSVFVNDWNRRVVYISTAISLPLSNAIGFIGFIFQAVNKTKIFSTTVIIDKLWFIAVVIVLIILNSDSFIWFIIFSIIGNLFALLYCLLNGHKFIFIKIESIKQTLKEMTINVSVGISLMFSNIASLLILGIGRFIVDKKWGIEVFGKFSFSLTLATFLLAFIAQVSMVLFPALRQTDEVQQKKFFLMSRDLLGIVLAGFLLAYMPMNYLLGIWLPQYKESLQYLILLLPLCIYEGKMNMLCSTYFKVLRKEKLLLKINLISLLLSVMLSIIGGYLFNSIYALIILIVFAVALRSIISEYCLSKMLGGGGLKSTVAESLLVIIFMSSTWFVGPFGGFILYLLSFCTYLILSRKKLEGVMVQTRKYFSKRTSSQI